MDSYIITLELRGLPIYDQSKTKEILEREKTSLTKLRWSEILFNPNRNRV